MGILRHEPLDRRGGPELCTVGITHVVWCSYTLRLAKFGLGGLGPGSIYIDRGGIGVGFGWVLGCVTGTGAGIEPGAV